MRKKQPVVVHTINIDRSVFQQTEQQKEDARRVKQEHKQKLREVYGDKYKKYLNLPDELQN